MLKCKIDGCGAKFADALAFMVHKQCDNPNCKCPEVQKIIQMTNNVIEKARKPNIIVTEHVPCTNDVQDFKDVKSRVYYEYPPIIVGTVKVEYKGRRNGKRGGK